MRAIALKTMAQALPENMRWDRRIMGFCVCFSESSCRRYGCRCSLAISTQQNIIISKAPVETAQIGPKKQKRKK